MNFNNKLKEYVPTRKEIVLIIFSAIIGIVLGAFLSNELSKFVPIFDKTPPSVIDIRPPANSIIYSLENLTFNISDIGVGVDINESNFELIGRNEGKINGSIINSNKTINFIPEKTLKPDIYTIVISAKDKAGNSMATPFSSVFYLSTNYTPTFWIKLSEHTYFPGDQIGNLKWTNSMKYYLFLLNNEKLPLIENFQVNLNFPHPIMGFSTHNLINAQNCKLKQPEGRTIITDGKPITVPSCDLTLECANLPKDGAYAGEIYVDPDYSGYAWMCNNKSDYSGSYFKNEFGQLKEEYISDRIK